MMQGSGARHFHMPKYFTDVAIYGILMNNMKAFTNYIDQHNSQICQRSKEFFYQVTGKIYIHWHAIIIFKTAQTINISLVYGWIYIRQQLPFKFKGTLFW